jgi:hypothetical protein
MAYTDIDKPTDYFNTKLYTGRWNIIKCNYRSWVSTRLGVVKS